MSNAALCRTAFTTDRTQEFFSESELRTQLGYGKSLWPLIVSKELMDNGLDIAESIDVLPVIRIELEPDRLIVTDNGPGIPQSVIEKSLDYSVRISDKKHYIAPTRGQLGNALKCTWAVPFVATGDTAHAEVISRGLHHDIDVSLDRISQRPDIRLSTQKLRSVKNGSSVRIDWKGIASLELDDEDADFYRQGTFDHQLVDLVLNFAAFNPHAEFHLKLPGRKPTIIHRSDKSWSKWRPCDPTSPHWYRPEDLRALIAAYISTGERKTLRNFVREFDGLSGTQYCKRVLDKAKLPDCSLLDMVSKGDIDLVRVGCLLDAMKEYSRPVKPKRLGIIGFGHLARHALMAGLTPHTMHYKKIVGFDGELPFVVEVGFGLKAEGPRELVVGLNNSTVFKIPTDDLSDAMSVARLDWSDPVVLYIHLCSPRIEFIDHGKGSFASGTAIGDALAKAIESATKEFTREKRQAAAARRDELTPEQIENLRVKEEKNEIKAAAYQVIERAYNLASDDGRLPARPRQIMYAARPLVLEITGGNCWRNSNYFTQKLLPDYREERPEQTLNWKIDYDARGHFREPHTGENFEIGTLEVREYRAAWRSNSTSTYGPENRFRYALFIEKEGFDSLLRESGIAERFDLAFYSSKGVSVTAARTLVEELSTSGVTTFVVHDFDFSGFTILHTLAHDTRRYKFSVAPKVIDLGLRLADVERMDLDKESVRMEQDKDPRIKLREYGALPDELEFLVGGKHGFGRGAYWDGARVELNAMTSPQLIDWLERKLEEHGVEKVIPKTELLGKVWQSEHRTHAYGKFAEKRLEEIQKDFDKQHKGPKTPKDLQARLARHFKTNPAASWNTAISDIALIDAEKQNSKSQ